MEPKYPTIEVKLSNTDGNAFAVIGLVNEALRDSGLCPTIERGKFLQDAIAGDYDHLLQTCLAWVTVN